MPASRFPGRWASALLFGLAKDRTTVPVAITLSPVPIAAGHFILVVIRPTAPPAAVTVI
jgi:hypothetical protein